MASPPRIFDRVLHRRRLDRAAGAFASADFLKARAAQDIVERLEAVRRRFPRAADLGARDGAFARALADSPVRGNIDFLVNADPSPAMLARLAGSRVALDEERLPFGPATLNLITSALCLHWVNDLVGALIQIRLALAPDGLSIGALLGGATLTELRGALLDAELELRGGAGPRVSPFVDLIDAPSLLQRAGFTLPVVDTDTVKVRYDHPMKLLADLRAMGETAALAQGSGRPLTRPILARACELYQQRHAQADGRVPATFEILTLTGWAPHPEQQQPLRPGSAKGRLADALGVVEHKAGGRAARSTEPKGGGGV